MDSAVLNMSLGLIRVPGGLLCCLPIVHQRENGGEWFLGLLLLVSLESDSLRVGTRLTNGADSDSKC